MRVLVTGSEGFVGKHVVAALEARGDKPQRYDKKIGVDIVDYPRVLDFGLTDQIIGADAVVHLAATCSTPGSIERPMETFRDTVRTAVNVLEAARKAKKPVLLTSSVKARDGRTPYGAAKRMVELWALEYRRSYGLPVIINRPGTIYGPGQEGSPESGWIAWFLKARDTGQQVTVNGDGWQVRDLLHVSDYVRLLLTQLDDIDTYNTGTIYDVGGGPLNAVTVNEMVRHLGLRAMYGPPRYGDSPVYIGDNNVPGWSPEVQWRDSETLGRRLVHDTHTMTICDCADCTCWMPAWPLNGEGRCYDCVNGHHHRLEAAT